MKIRSYKLSDKERLREICLRTSSYADRPSEARKNALCALYNDYYTECEADNCFVAADDADEATGYVVCSTCLSDYLAAMQNRYTAIAKAAGRPFAGLEQRVTEALLSKHAEEGYTAHLHINLLDEARHQGVGSALMRTLAKHLADRNVEGVMLICGSNNTNARNFYERCGFELLQKFFCACVYGAFTEDLVRKLSE